MVANGDDVDVLFSVAPSYAQVEIRDRDNVDVPEWETGEEPVVHNADMISVATRPDSDGDVLIRVVSGSASVVEGNEIFAGELSVPSGVLVVGNTLSEDLREINVTPAKSVSVLVITDPPLQPQSVTFVIRSGSSDAGFVG
jgi:hypothetical protein